MQSPLTAFAETESGVRSGKLNHPKGTFHYGPIAAVLAWWKDSKQRLVASEFCRFPRRIVAMWRDAGLRFGPAVPSDPRRNNQWSLAQESIFLFSCSDSIKQLSQRHVWMGPLDQQLAGEAFQAGASWAFRNQDSGKTAVIAVPVNCPQCGAKVVTVNAAVAEWIQIPDAHCDCGFNGVIEWTNPRLEASAAQVL